MTDNKYTRIPADTAIAYTDRELLDCRHSVAEAIKTAEAIHKDRGFGPLRFKDKHTARFSLVANTKINIAQHNSVIADVLAHEHEYSRTNPKAVIPTNQNARY